MEVFNYNMQNHTQLILSGQRTVQNTNTCAEVRLSLQIQREIPTEFIGMCGTTSLLITVKILPHLCTFLQSGHDTSAYTALTDFLNESVGHSIFKQQIWISR